MYNDSFLDSFGNKQVPILATFRIVSGKPLELLSHKMLYVNQKMEEQKQDQIAAANDSVHCGDANIMNGVGMPQTFFSTDSSYDTSYIDQHFNKAYVDGDYSFVSDF